ncbi:MAG: acyltransferase [Lachnospiraceae bacterium]|nr:acyltransferase [Lachnospiraceae bacterium]
MIDNYKTRHYYGFDFLKAVGCFLILFHHYVDDTGVDWPGSNIHLGYIVEMFFIISGILSYKYVNGIEQDTPIGRILIRKYLRFLPMLLSGGIVCGILDYIYDVTLNGRVWGYSTQTVVFSLFGVSRWFSEDYMLNNPVWYISVLLLVYVVFFAATKLSKKAGINPVIVYVVLFVAGNVLRFMAGKGYISGPFLGVSIGRGLIGFFEGILLWSVVERFGLRERKEATIVAGLIGVATITVFIVYPGFAEVGEYYKLLLILFPALAVFFGGFMFDNVPENVFTKNISKASYYFYIWHYPVIMVFFVLDAKVGVNFADVTVFAGTFVGTLLLSIIMTCTSMAVIHKRKNTMQM